MRRLLIPVLIVLMSGAVRASSTQEMKIEGSAAFLEGKFSGAGLNDQGELVMGYQAVNSASVEDAAYLIAHATLRNKDYFSAGYPATVVSYDGKSAVTAARFPGDVAVSALASDGRHLYAAALPSALIYKVDDKGNTSPFADFSTGAVTPNYVWALTVYKGALYAALGGHFPSVYKMDLKTAKKELLYQVEGKAKNVTALMVEDAGIFFGDDAGRVFYQSHGAPAQVNVLYAFSDAEIRALAPFAGGLAVVVNSRRFVPPPPPQQPPVKDPSAPSGDPAVEEGELDVGLDLKRAIEQVATSIEAGVKARSEELTGTATIAVNGKPTPVPTPAKPESPAAQAPSAPQTYQDPFGKGEGNLFWMATDGMQVHRLWFSPSSIALSIWPADAGLLVATSSPARLYRITRDGAERLLFESKSKDLSIITASGKRLVAAASNPAVLFELEPATQGDYSSKVFDAGFPTKIGKADVTGAGAESAGTMIRWGATADIDSGWTEFKALGGAPVPVGRFFQVKLKFKSGDAAIRRIRVPYRVQNLYPRLINLSADVQRSQDGSMDGKDIRFQWDVTNLDNDLLQYQISYQPPGAKKFISVFEPSDRPKNVKTVTLPAEQFGDGTYRFRLDVTDDLSNGSPAALTHQAEFPLVLLDRTPPAVELKQEGDQVRWQATDPSSRISKVDYRVDGGPWQSLTSEDGLFDSPQETGRLSSESLPGGSVIDFRAADERENSRIYSLILK